MNDPISAGEEVARRYSKKRFTDKFHKIHMEIQILEFLNFTKIFIEWNRTSLFLSIFEGMLPSQIQLLLLLTCSNLSLFSCPGLDSIQEQIIKMNQIKTLREVKPVWWFARYAGKS